MPVQRFHQIDVDSSVLKGTAATATTFRTLRFPLSAGGGTDDMATADPSSGDTTEEEEQGYTAFRTPVLLRVEEERLLQLWTMLLDVCDYEARSGADDSSASLFDLDSGSFETLKNPKLSTASAASAAEPSDKSRSSNAFKCLRRVGSSISHRSSCSIGSTSTRTTSFRASTSRRHRPPLPPDQTTAPSSPSGPATIPPFDFDLAASLPPPVPPPKDNAVSAADRRPFRASLWLALKDDHPDEILYRFLKRQDWSVPAAFDAVVATLRWRTFDIRVAELMRAGEHGAYARLNSPDPIQRGVARGFLEQLWQGRGFVRGTDRDGRPIAYVRCRNHRRGAQPQESMRQFAIFLIEIGRMIAGPAIDNVLFIWDCSGASYRNHDLETILYLRDIMLTHYPLALGQVIVHGAPRYWESLWKLVRPLMGPELSASVHFSHSVADLEKFAARDQILKEMGGDDDWTYAYTPPSPGEDAALDDHTARARLTALREREVQTFEKLTRATVAANRNGEDLTDLRRVRDESVDRLREHFWKLDPHVRSRCVYDRWGAFAERKDAALKNANWLHWRGVRRGRMY